MEHLLNLKLDAIKAKAATVHCLQILENGYSDAPVHLKEYEELAYLVKRMAYADAQRCATPEVTARQGVLASLGRGEPGHFKTWTDLTVERLNEMSQGRVPSDVSLVEVKLYLFEFKSFLTELGKCT